MELIRTDKMSHEDWLELRKLGIGGSDMGIILGVNPWMSKIQLFYQKLGMFPESNLDTENESVFWGKVTEELILENTQYYDFMFPKDYMKNKMFKNKKRHNYPFPYMGVSDRHPFLRGNFDGLTFNEEIELVQNESGIWELPTIVVPDFVTEIKTIGGRAADMWEEGVPPGYKVQLMTYKIIWKEVNPHIEGLLFSLVDGNRLEGEYMPSDYAFEIDINGVSTRVDDDYILEEGEKFFRLMVRGHEIIENSSSEEQAMMGLQEIEPGPDDSEAYYKFMSERQKDKLSMNVMKGTDEHRNLAAQYKRVHKEIKVLDKEKQIYKNQIIKALDENDCKAIEFEEGEGKISYSNSLYVNTKF